MAIYMSILDDLILNAKTAVNAVSKKAEKVIDVSKLKYAESGLQSEIYKKQQALGEFVYASCVSGVMDKELLNKKVEELKELNESLDSTRELINAQKNKVTCKACGEVVSAELQYCGKCGAKLYSDDPAVDADVDEASQPTDENEAKSKAEPDAEENTDAQNDVAEADAAQNNEEGLVDEEQSDAEPQQ